MNQRQKKKSVEVTGLEKLMDFTNNINNNNNENNYNNTWKLMY